MAITCVVLSIHEAMDDFLFIRSLLMNLFDVLGFFIIGLLLGILLILRLGGSLGNGVKSLGLR